MADHDIRIRMVPSLAEISAADWDACAGQLPHRARTPSTNPQPPGDDLSTGAAGVRPVHRTAGDKPELHVKSEDELSPELSTRGLVDNPFVSHDFLLSL